MKNIRCPFCGVSIFEYAYEDILVMENLVSHIYNHCPLSNYTFSIREWITKPEIDKQLAVEENADKLNRVIDLISIIHTNYLDGVICILEVLAKNGVKNK